MREKGQEGTRLLGFRHTHRMELTRLTKKQADYIGVPVEGPYKPEHYRY